MTELPIESVLPALRDRLRTGTSAVLQAPPGAGKTTRVPLALLDEPWLAGGRVLLLEPRRLAARAAARRMAGTLGEDIGGTVGYRVRHDSRTGRSTRIEVVTEGILTRMIQSDPALEGVGLVIFDEFHERSLHADLGLALALQVRALLRDDLRILVMSATLDGGPVAELLGGAPIVTSEGRSFAVDTRYLPHPWEGALEALVERTVLQALQREQGDILVFLPGAAEIRRVQERLLESGLGPEVRIAPLFGNLPQADQDRAMEPSPPGVRKVVLSTSIAETSLTIQGVRTVIDSGRMRVPRFSPRTGMTRLETVPVSRAAADQRRGRAGRLGPGVCYRLWTEAEQHGLVPHGTPEIQSADLASLALELASWGIPDPADLAWLDPPPEAAFSQARELLAELGALEGGAITPHGREIADSGIHPRLAHMVLRGRELGHGALACDVAALLSERDLFRVDPLHADADLRARVEALRHGVRDPRVEAATLHRVRAESRHLRQRFGIREEPVDAAATGRLLALAYPDRVAQLRQGEPGRYLLRNGRGAALPPAQPLAREPYLVVAEVDGQGRESRIFRAAPVELSDLESLFGGWIEEDRVVAWDREVGSVRALRRERLGSLTLRVGSIADPDPAEVAEALLGGIREEGLQILPWSDAARQLQQRMLFMRSLDPDWVDASDGALLEGLQSWLEPHLWGVRRREELQRVDLEAALLGMLTWEQRAALEENAPTHLGVPSGSRIRIDYGDPAAPVLPVRLQEMFGQAETPRIGRGRVPLTVHLLSPAGRPVQVTRDLASFWRSAYFEVRKDLRGRYPKHHWPDDPLAAEATRRTRRRG